MGERKRRENRRRRGRRKPKRQRESQSGKDQQRNVGATSSVGDIPPQQEEANVMIYTYTRYKRAR